MALFVDGDNLPPSLSGPILEAAGRLGQVDVRRVYAAEAGFRAWEAAAGYRPIRVGGAKNGTDLLLSIEAVEIVCRGGFDALVVASNDRDFSHLAHWVRERGTHVLGLGTTLSSPGWRAACSTFEFLETPVPLPATPEPTASRAVPANLSKLDCKIRDLIRAEGEKGSMGMGSLGSRMGSVHKVTLLQLGAKSWRAYLSGKPTLYKVDDKGTTARVHWIGP